MPSSQAMLISFLGIFMHQFCECGAHLSEFFRQEKKNIAYAFGRQWTQLKY